MCCITVKSNSSARQRRFAMKRISRFRLTSVCVCMCVCYYMSVCLSCAAVWVSEGNIIVISSFSGYEPVWACAAQCRQVNTVGQSDTLLRIITVRRFLSLLLLQQRPKSTPGYTGLAVTLLLSFTAVTPGPPPRGSLQEIRPTLFRRGLLEWDGGGGGVGGGEGLCDYSRWYTRELRLLTVDVSFVNWIGAE